MDIESKLLENIELNKKSLCCQNSLFAIYQEHFKLKLLDNIKVLIKPTN